MIDTIYVVGAVITALITFYKLYIDGYCRRCSGTSVFLGDCIVSIFSGFVWPFYLLTLPFLALLTIDSYLKNRKRRNTNGR